MNQTIPTNDGWLQRYYFIRAGVSIVWIIAVLTVAQGSPGLNAALLIAYPLWDALANFVDARRSGGFGANRTQLVNVIASIAVAIALAIALPNMHHALGVFGVWAILSGLLQLGTGLGRWKKHGAQWAMILSGGQSALAGAFFIFQAQLPVTPTVASLAGYAGFGAFYFLLSGVMLGVSAWRQKNA